MKTKRRRNSKVYDRTYRTSPSAGSVWSLAQKLLGEKVVVYLDDPSYPAEQQWKGGRLVGLIPGDDAFIIKWSRKGFGRTLKGIWRVHPASLFTGTNLLPIPKYPARLPQSHTNQRSKEERMATKKASTKTSSKTKKAAPKAEASNGAKKSGAKPRVADKLEGLTEARRRNIAKLIHRERSKSPATSWTDIGTMIEEKYDWTLPGSMTGRRLLREYGPDNAEEAIIKQDRKAKSTKATKTTKAKKKAPVVEEEDEDEEEELEDEDEDIEDEADLEDEDDLEDDEDEDEEEPPAKPARKVRVTKGRGKKANPSK